jgi:hypothetical protein
MISLVKLSYIIGIIILILIPLTILLFLKVYERFEVAEKNKDEETIHKFITYLDESFCPAIIHIQEDVVNRTRLTGSEEEKTTQASKLMALEAGGSLFPCPAPSDPVDISADIADRIVRTSPYLYKKVERALNKTKDALNCKKPSKDDDEGFDGSTDGSTDESTDKIQTNQPTMNTNASSSKPSKEDRATIIKLRAASLTSVLSNPNIINQITLVHFKSNELLTIKKLAEENKIRPTCQKEDEDSSSSINL